MRALSERCDRVGALLVFDEVLTGFARTGKLFALEHFGVIPDIIVLAKALGGGLPLGAFVARDEIQRVLAHDPPLGHITTFGGHPLSCAAGLTALETIVREGLAKRADAAGATLREELARWVGDGIVAVRGLGLLVGIEFADPALARRFTAETIANGVIVNWTLNEDRVVRIAPPLVISDDELALGIRVMAAALETARRGGKSDG
jgi:acetylornithine/succinyldiaminopimelate/putrescine aminotransferase